MLAADKNDSFGMDGVNDTVLTFRRVSKENEKDSGDPLPSKYNSARGVRLSGAVGEQGHYSRKWN